VSLGARIARQPLALLGEFGGQQSSGSDRPAPPATSERAMEAVVGAAVETGELARRGARSILGINRRVWRMTEPARQPLDALGITAAVQRPVQAVAERVEAQVDTLQAIGRSEVEASRQRVIGTLGGTIDGIIAYLTDNAQVDALIHAQVDKLLPFLAGHPAVESLIEVQVDKILPKLVDSPAIQRLIEAQVAQFLPKLADDFAIQTLIRQQAGAYLLYLSQNSEQIQALIRQQGDIYIEYLNDHPDAVQNLVSGQSLGIAGQVMDEVRERTVTADTVAEMFVRRILGRRARTEIDEPPDVVQRRATAAVLPSDFVQQKERADGTGN
jgi:hypothetical protein